MKLSVRAQTTAASPLRSLSLPLDSNIHIHRLNIGQPNIDSPKEFFDGLNKYPNSVVAYDAASGNQTLIQEWTKLLNRQYSIDITAEQMLITSGSSEALTFVFSICCDANDEIIIFNPSYANYSGFAAISGVNLIPVECDFSTGFHSPSNIAQIENKINTNTKAILLCNPNNPTGTTFTHQELSDILDLCKTHELVLIVDEVYREFVYDNITPSSIFQIAPKDERIIVIDSLSKRYSLCGARVGCLITWNKEIMIAAKNFASTRVSGPAIEQFAAAHMLQNLSDNYLNCAIEEYKRRRDVLADGLSMIEGVEFNMPEGGFYFLVKLPVDDSVKFAQFMLRDFSMNNETVFVSPASAFFINNTTQNNYVRVAFMASTEELSRAVKIIEAALVVYNTRSNT
jgi:aspartate aminotransferase